MQPFSRLHTCAYKVRCLPDCVTPQRTWTALARTGAGAALSPWLALLQPPPPHRVDSSCTASACIAWLAAFQWAAQHHLAKARHACSHPALLRQVQCQLAVLLVHAAGAWHRIEGPSRLGRAGRSFSRACGIAGYHGSGSTNCLIACALLLGPAPPGSHLLEHDCAACLPVFLQQLASGGAAPPCKVVFQEVG